MGDAAGWTAFVAVVGPILGAGIMWLWPRIRSWRLAYVKQSKALREEQRKAEREEHDDDVEAWKALLYHTQEQREAENKFHREENARLTAKLDEYIKLVADLRVLVAVCERDKAGLETLIAELRKRVDV